MSDELNYAAQMHDAAPSWAEWLTAFDQEMWPVFQAHGYTKSAAIMSYHMNQLLNKLEEQDPPDDGWRR